MSFLPESAGGELRKAKALVSSLSWQKALLIAIATAAAIMLGFSVPSEYFMGLAVFDYLSPVEGSENYVSISNELKAFVFLLALVAVHLAAPHKQNLTVNRAIISLSVILFVTAGFGLAYVNVEPWLSANDVPAVLNNLDDGSSSEEHWLVEGFKTYVLPVYPMLFALGMPIMTLVVAYVTHRLIGILLFSIKEIIRLRMLKRELEEPSENIMEGAVSRYETNQEIELKSREIKQRDLPDMIYVVAKVALSKGKKTVNEREMFPDLQQVISDAQEDQTKKSLFVSLPIEEAKALIEKLEQQITIENIREAVEGK